MSKAKVHVLEDLLSGESMTVDQLTFGLETVMGMIGADSAVRFKQGNVLSNNKVVAIYQNSAYAWYGDYPKTIDVDTPDLEQGWKALDRVVNNTDTVRESLKRLAAEAGFNLVDGSFDNGATVTEPTDVIWDEFSGKYYSWGGSLPKTVAAGFDPTTNLASNAWVDRTQGTLRGTLVSNNGADLVKTDDGKSVQNHITHAERLTSAVSVSRSSLPRFSSKLNQYAHGAIAQTFRVYGFGSSVGNGASLPDPMTQAPVHKLTELFNRFVNVGGIWPIISENHSVDGSTISQFPEAWASAIATSTPDLVVFAYGMNDFQTAIYNAGQTFGPHGFEQMLRDSISIVQSAGADVILFTTPHPHTQRVTWALPVGIPQIWPTFVADPVPAESLFPPVSQSIVSVDYTGDGDIIPAAHRFLRGNEAIRRVGAETGCVVIDIEQLWFDAVFKNGEDALYNLGERVHPNLLGHTLSYWLGAEIFCRAIGQSSLTDHRSPEVKLRNFVGGRSTFPNPKNAMSVIVSDPTQPTITNQYDHTGQLRHSTKSNGDRESHGGKDIIFASPDYLGNAGVSLERYLKTGVPMELGDTLTVSLLQRNAARLFISGWTSSNYTYAQSTELMCFNSEGTIIHNVISNIDNTTGNLIYTVSYSGNDVIITSNIANTTIKCYVEQLT